MFIKQSLALDRSCQRAVDAWAGQRAAEGFSVQSIATGGYCRARTRLPLEMLVALTRETGRLLSAQAPQNWGWRGRCVKLADGKRSPAGVFSYRVNPYAIERSG
jgi:hypothetical protein